MSIQGKKPKGFNGQWYAENIANKPGITRPCHSKLEFKYNAGNNTQGKNDHKKLPEKFVSLL
jgi:hypothetical protein